MVAPCETRCDRSHTTTCAGEITCLTDEMRSVRRQLDVGERQSRVRRCAGQEPSREHRSERCEHRSESYEQRDGPYEHGVDEF